MSRNNSLEWLFNVTTIVQTSARHGQIFGKYLTDQRVLFLAGGSEMSFIKQ